MTVCVNETAAVHGISTEERAAVKSVKEPVLPLYWPLIIELLIPLLIKTHLEPCRTLLTVTLEPVDFSQLFELLRNSVEGRWRENTGVRGPAWALILGPT